MNWNSPLMFLREEQVRNMFPRAHAAMPYPPDPPAKDAPPSFSLVMVGPNTSPVLCYQPDHDTIGLHLWIGEKWHAWMDEDGQNIIKGIPVTVLGQVG